MEPERSCSSLPVIDFAPSSVKRPSSIAESKTLDGQKPKPTSMIRAGDKAFIANIPFLANSGCGAAHYAASASASASKSLAPSPRHVLPCMHASVVGAAAASLSSIVRVCGVCE